MNDILKKLSATITSVTETLDMDYIREDNICIKYFNSNVFRSYSEYHKEIRENQLEYDLKYNRVKSVSELKYPNELLPKVYLTYTEHIITEINKYIDIVLNDYSSTFHIIDESILNEHLAPCDIIPLFDRLIKQGDFRNYSLPLDFIEYLKPPFVPGHIITYSKHYLHVFKPDPARINLVDIYKGLVENPRFNNQTEHKITVLEHSIWVFKQGDQSIKARRQKLLHDAFEAFFGDIPKPLKVFMELFDMVEDHWMGIIAEKFNFEWPMYPDTKEWDYRAISDREFDVHVLSRRAETWPCLMEDDWVEWLKALCECYPEGVPLEWFGNRGWIWNDYEFSGIGFIVIDDKIFKL